MAERPGQHDAMNPFERHACAQIKPHNYSPFYKI